MYVGGKQPTYEDREMLEQIGEGAPDPEVYPHAFAWYCIVSRFTPEVRAQWAGLKPKTGDDWKNVLGKSINVYFRTSLSASFVFNRSPT